MLSITEVLHILADAVHVAEDVREQLHAAITATEPPADAGEQQAPEGA